MEQPRVTPLQASDKPSCCIIGSGNVASHLARGLMGHMHIRQVFSPNLSHAASLADAVGGRPIDSLSSLVTDAEFYLISVSDDAVVDVVRRTSSITGGLWAHTSGSIPIDVFKGYKENYGVFYPLQTFSKAKSLDLSCVPMLIEGSSPEVTSGLVGLAHTFSNNVLTVDSDARKCIHVAAVFACNFTNFLFMQADEILRDNNFDFSILKPLIHETMDKLDKLSPQEAQTGPARRGDTEVISRHLDMLPPDKARVYRLLSDMILNKFS